jgi:hypothetical protein
VKYRNEIDDAIYFIEEQGKFIYIVKLVLFEAIAVSEKLPFLHKSFNRIFYKINMLNCKKYSGGNILNNRFPGNIFLE